MAKKTKQYKLLIDIGKCKAGSISKVNIQCDTMSFASNEDKKIRRTYKQEEIPLLIKQGIIKEVPEGKWTDEEMFDYSKYLIMRYDELKNAIQEQNNVELEVKLNMFLMEYEKSRQTKNI